MAHHLRDYRQSQSAYLLRAQRTSQATIDSFPDPVLVVDSEGRVEMANPAARRLLGVAQREREQPASGTWQPPEQLREQLNDALLGQRDYLPEGFDQIVLLGESGRERAFLPRILTIRDPNGRTLGAAVLLQDVTRLRLLDQMKGDLVATASHELKTPLTSVRLAVHLLLEESTGPLTPKQTELLLDARENSERLLAMVNNLLDLARLEQGWRQLDVHPASPVSLLRDAADAVHVRAQDKKVVVAIEVPDALPSVAVDKERIGHALRNLVDNALTYTDAGGRIGLSAEAGWRLRSFCRSVTRGQGSLLSTCHESLRNSFVSPDKAGEAARDWGWPLSMKSSSDTAERFPVKVSQESEQLFAFDCRLLDPEIVRVTDEQRCCRTSFRRIATRSAVVSDDQVATTPEQFLTLIRQQRRGRLKIYLGFAAGVGKTYEMLQEGQRLKARGVDVVIGVVETHGRADTAAQISNLEQVPRRKIEYRGVEIEEMDLDAILARHPAVVLVDELAHTNAPGSRYSKRYQDIEELLRAGINVISTLNIQHLESLYDMVERATGVKVKERVPDYIIGLADQLINVDLSAEDLRERLTAGKVYPAERIDRALESFFTQANLTRLREFALEEIAHRLDQRLIKSGRLQRSRACARSHHGLPEFTRSQCRSPDSQGGAHAPIASGAPWYAVYIQTPDEDLTRISAAVQRQISNNLALVQQLGGTQMTFKGADVVSTVAAFAKEYGISHIVIGRTRRPWYRRLFGQSVLDRLLQAIPEVDVIVAGNS